MNKKVAIILVNWNSYTHSSNCIHSLREMMFTNFDIILVDNASEDQSGKQLQAAFPDLMYIQSTSNLGFTGGNNLGIKKAIEGNYTYTLLLNNDTLVTPSLLGQLVSFMDLHKDTGAVQPKIYFAHEPVKVWSSGGSYIKSLGYTITHHKDDAGNASDDIHSIDWISGCAFFCRTEIFKKVGLLADNMFMYFEDVDLSFRFRKAGYALRYLPSAVVYHVAGASGKQKIKGEEGYVHASIHYYNVRNRLWIAKKYTPLVLIPSVFLFNFFYIILLIAYFALRGRFKKLATVLRAVNDGLKGQIIDH